MPAFLFPHPAETSTTAISEAGLGKKRTTAMMICDDDLLAHRIMSIGLAVVGSIKYFFKIKIVPNQPTSPEERRFVVKYVEKGVTIWSALPAIIVLLCSTTLGAMLYKAGQGSILLYSSIIMFVCALPPRKYAAYLSNVGEVIYIYGFVAALGQVLA